MSIRGPDRARVAEVIGSGGTYGSGYRISTHLVLAAAHLFPPETFGHRVRFASGQFLPARLVWRGGKELDVAILRLDLSSEGEVAPVVFGQLRDGLERPGFEVVGFPAFSARDGGIRDAKHVSGTIQPLSYDKSGLLDLNITTAAPRDAEDNPWRGFSGAAVFSEDGHLIGVVSRRLPRAGTSSADASNIVLAFDQPGFREALAADGLWAVPVQVSGASAGLRLAPVLEHSQALASLVGMRRNLTDERLPFVSPGQDHASNPANLLRRLQDRANDRGAVLVGPAGSGKSRTCFEVAKLAELAGWRALHVVPGEPLATNDHIAEAVFGGSKPAVLIIDYLNECRGIDLLDLRQRLLPEAKNRGIPVGVLASARPGWLLTAEGEHVRWTFDDVELRVDGEHTTAVRKNILAAEAPKALAELGDDRLAALCGARPIIAMLIAREIEHRVLAGSLSKDVLGLRTGDLLGWLERRLEEDDLHTRRPRSALDIVEPGPLVKASAALTAACPQERSALEATAAYVLERHGLDGWRAAQLVDVLLKMGWLEAEGKSLAVVHDLVTDQLLEQTLLQAPSARVNPSAAETILTPCLHDARTLGRFAVNLGRLLRDLDLDNRANSLNAFCDNWMRRHDRDVGRVLENDPDPGGYALGSVLDGPPWAATAIDCWSTLVGPWLSEHGPTRHARHVFYKGLRIVPHGAASDLIDGALDWLRKHSLLAEAGFVVGALLGRADLGDRAPAVVADAVRWLERPSLPSTARFVIKALLERSDLGGEASVVIGLAVRWLGQYWDTSSAGFVFGPLLERSDLDGEASVVIGLAVRWLGQYWDTSSADFVFGPLLERSDLDGEASVVIAHAVNWLERYGDGAEADFVIKALLARTDLGGKAAIVFTHAVNWLERYRDGAEADFVIKALLERTDLGGKAAIIIAFAVDWVTQHIGNPGVSFVLHRLFERPEFVEVPDELLRAVDRWADCDADDNIVYVTKPLFKKDIISPSICAAVLRWIQRRPSDPDSAWRLSALLHLVEGRREYEGLWAQFLDRVEQLLDNARQTSELDDSNQLDLMMMNLASCFRLGYWGTRADDLIQRWCFLDVSMSTARSVREDSSFVGRVVGLIEAGRIPKHEIPQILAKLRTWVGNWDRNRQRGSKQGPASLLIIENAERRYIS